VRRSRRESSTTSWVIFSMGVAMGTCYVARVNEPSAVILPKIRDLT
jgi:hypothetical protein